MSRLSEIVGAFAEVDAALFALVAVVLGVLAFTRKRRPFAMSRAMDVAISTVLFIMLGIRYVVLAALTLVFPAQIVGSAAGPTLPIIIAACYAVAGAIGLATHRLAEVRARVLGTLVLVLVTVLEALAGTFMLHRGVVEQLDTLLSVLIAVGACVCAAFFWTYRTAVPDPLGGDKRPLDY